MKKAIDFLITQNCNFRCPYCSQSKKFASGKTLQDADSETISAFFRLLEKLPRDFEITISGGEPLCHKKFFEVVQKITDLGFKISVVSNFSFPFEHYKRLKEIAGENLSELFVSLHLSQVKNVDEFLQKAKDFNSLKGNSKFTIGSVLTDENCEKLKSVAKFLKENGIDFELQHLRIKNEFVKYNEEAQNFILEFPISKIKEMSDTYGKICRAGLDFMFIYQNGDAYRCYSSRFNKIHSMGNIKSKNFKMYEKPLPCLNKKCTCPKPIINGLIEFDKKSIAQAVLLSAYNALFLPFYAVCNFDIVRTKITQAVKFKNNTK